MVREYLTCAEKWRHLMKVNNPDFVYANEYLLIDTPTYKSARSHGTNLRRWHGVTRRQKQTGKDGILFDV